jgi:death on curing protein
MATRHLSVAEVIALHNEMMRRFGRQAEHVRDENALGSAVARPRMAEHYEGADIVRQAALLAAGISQARSFVDGNKRTALVACRVFLAMNGLDLPGVSLEFAKQLELIAERPGERDAATDDFEAWLRERVRPIEPGD